jgi:hypothetical protein
LKTIVSVIDVVRKGALCKLNLMKDVNPTIPRIVNAFKLWEEGMNDDSAGYYGLSASKFQLAAQSFFEAGSPESKQVKAYYEYSTLMDAYARIQQGRQLLESRQFDEALGKFTESAKILRSTIHFGFLAPYVSACAITQVTELGERNEEESIEGYKNAIALFEQSKIALSFRDELDSIIRKIDKYIRFCVSQALYLESLQHLRSGDTLIAADKENRARAVKQEYLSDANNNLGNAAKLQFLPLLDFKRVDEGAFVVSYPDADGLWLVNIGQNPAHLIKIGSLSLGQVLLGAQDSVHFNASEIGKGKIRLEYEDKATGKKYNEGCVLII